MEELLVYVPEDKREEFKTKASGYVKMTDEIAFEHVRKSQSLTDKIATPIVEARFRNFEETKLSQRLEEEREKVRKEFAPKDETPEQKELRALKEWKDQTLREKLNEERKTSLRKKASDLGLDPLKAEKLYPLNDAEEFLESQAKEIEAYKTKISDYEKQLKFGSGSPMGGRAATVNELDSMKKEYVRLNNTGDRVNANLLWLKIKEQEAKNG
jgi:hypothetical protein